MAQQIQFIQLTQAQYDGLGTKANNRLYFTSDTHRIYKGENLYAATEFDQLNFTNIEASGITVNGVDVALSGHTHAMQDVSGLGDALTGLTATSITKTNASFSGTVSAGNGNFSGTLSAVTISGSNITMTQAVTADTGTFANLTVTNTASFTATNISADTLTVGGSSVALSGHTHTKAQITDFSHTHSINDITNLATSLTGITQTNITKTGTISAATVRGTTGSFTTVSAGTVSAPTVSAGTALTLGGKSVATQEWVLANAGGWQEGSDLTCSKLTATNSAVFQKSVTVSSLLTAKSGLSVTGTVSASSGQFSTSLTVGGSSVALVGHTHSAADLSGIQFDEMTIGELVASSITVDGHGLVQGGTSQYYLNGVTISISIDQYTASPTITFGGIMGAATKEAVSQSTQFTNKRTGLPTVQAVMDYVDSVIGTILSSSY